MENRKLDEKDVIMLKQLGWVEGMYNYPVIKRMEELPEYLILDCMGYFNKEFGALIVYKDNKLQILTLLNNKFIFDSKYDKELTEENYIKEIVNITFKINNYE